MSLQTETLLSLFDHLDNEKQSLFLKELTSRLDVPKLEELCSVLPEILKSKIILCISQLLNELGYNRDFEITKFLFDRDTFEFTLHVISDGVSCRFRSSLITMDVVGDHKDLTDFMARHRHYIYGKVSQIVEAFDIQNDWET
jgi:hypothetical protein